MASRNTKRLDLTAPLADMPGLVRIADTFFALDEAAFEGAKAKLVAAGCEAKDAGRPRPEGSLFVSLDFERAHRVRCDHCQALVSSLGSRLRTGLWCESCGELIHFEMFPGSLIGISRYEDLPGGDRRGHNFRLALLDYDPEAGVAFLGTTLLPSRGHGCLEWPDDGARERAEAAFAPVRAALTLGERTHAGDVRGGKLVRKACAPSPAYVVPYSGPGGAENSGSRAWNFDDFQPAKVYHAGSEIRLFDGREFEGDSLFTFEGSLWLVPAWRHYPLQPSPELHNLVLEAVDTGLTLLPDFIKPFADCVCVRKPEEAVLRT